MLSLDNICHKYMFDEVVSGISLTVNKGDVVSLVGPSGCGKTTLLSICAGLLTPTEGVVRNEFQTTSMVFQEDRLLPWRTAWENIALGLKAKKIKKKERREVAEKIGKLLRLEDLDLIKYPDAMSGGMRQRVAIGRALAVEPDFLLLDEPFNSLDVGLRRELQDLVMEQIRGAGLTAVFITHDLLEAVRVSSKLYVFEPNPGRIVRELNFDKPVEERQDREIYEQAGGLLEESAVRRAFGLDERAVA